MGELLLHFFKDFTHYDSKFFRSVRLLFFHPGMLPLAYYEGKRSGYLNPVRMYVFTSAVFFLVFYTLFTPREDSLKQLSAMQPDTLQWDRLQEKAYDNARTPADTLALDTLFARIRPVDPFLKDAKDTMTSEEADKLDFQLSSESDFLRYRSQREYDSLQSTLQETARDGWMKRQLIHRQLILREKYKDDWKRMLMDLINKFIHLFPYLLFISLPLFALFLKLIYLRHRRLYFADHFVFLLYLYIFTFLFLLLFFALNTLQERTGWGWINWILFFYTLYGIYYAYRSMRNYYLQGRWKTIFKFFLLNTLASVTLLFLFLLFIVISVFQI